MIRELIKKILIEAITPNVFYHGSDAMFDSFKGQNDVGYQKKHSVTDQGIYFNEGSAPMMRYGKYLYKVSLDIDNPFVIDNRTLLSSIAQRLRYWNVFNI